MQSLGDVSQQSLPPQRDFLGDRDRQGDALSRTTQFLWSFWTAIQANRAEMARAELASTTQDCIFFTL